MKMHKPRKNTDTHVIRCILLNINDHYSSCFQDYAITKSRYVTLLNALEELDLIKQHDDSGINTLNYVIVDITKYEEWSKSGFYKKIDKYVLPLIELTSSVLEHIPIVI